MTFTTISPQEFDQFAQTVSLRYFEQSSQFGDLLTKRGYTVAYLAFKDQTGLIQAAAVSWATPVAGGLQLKIHYGPIYADQAFVPDFLRGLQTYAKANQIIEIELNPYDIYQTFDDQGQPISPENTQLIKTYEEAGFSFGGLTTGFETSDWHYVKDLSGLDAKSLIPSFSKKGKALVKKAKTFGIRLRALERHELMAFKQITEATSDRRAFDDKPLAYYEYLYDSFGDKAQFMVASLNFNTYLQNLLKDQAKLKAKLDKLAADLAANPGSEKKQNQHREFSSQHDTFTVRIEEAQDLLAKYGDQEVILAASIFIYMPTEAIYFLSGSYTEFNKFYAPALLQEYVMLKAIELGIPKYNLLGFSGIFDGQDGVLRFKQNFNGHIERRPGMFYYYPRPLKYKLIKLVKTLLRR